MNKIDIRALAAAGGVLWGLYMLLVGWTSMLFGWGTEFVRVMSSVYIGFRPTFFGAVIGAVWGIVDGAIAGAVIAAVYNAATRSRRHP